MPRRSGRPAESVEEQRPETFTVTVPSRNRLWAGLSLLALCFFVTLVFSSRLRSRPDPLQTFLNSARIHSSNQTHGLPPALHSTENPISRPRIELHPEDHVHRGPLVQQIDWTITSDLQRPDGVLKRVVLVNGAYCLSCFIAQLTRLWFKVSFLVPRLKRVRAIL